MLKFPMKKERKRKGKEEQEKEAKEKGGKEGEKEKEYDWQYDKNKTNEKETNEILCHFIFYLRGGGGSPSAQVLVFKRNYQGCQKGPRSPQFLSPYCEKVY